MKCDTCGTKKDVEKMDDPFSKEIYDEIVKIKICPSCLSKLLDEI